MGYVRTEMITTPGEFSVRGGIIDIYPLTEAESVSELSYLIQKLIPFVPFH